MASRRDWLEAGLAVLGQDGAPALTIERLTGMLEVTKGSFYHHFKGMAGYRTALLEHYESEHTRRHIAEAERAGASAEDRLHRLMELALADKPGTDGLETAVRAWALQDPEVRRLQERVDRLRIDYLESLTAGLPGDDTAAPALARLLYLLLVGSQQLVPPLPAAELRDVYALALRPALHRKAEHP
ncbi:TetR/AcrR family transcriptional regulator [Streptomyces pharetrae]|jgi:AcrR family transcriptional regulator|uniref:TetR/AcrR family transcriptional regulator n=1 Tax=Streptomyces pharetrae TaxID=291370 RepID=UPI00345FF37E